MHWLIRSFRHRSAGDNLHHVAGSLLIVAGKIQRRGSQSLRANSPAGNDKKRNGCEGQKGRSFLHGREVCRESRFLASFFLKKSEAGKSVPLPPEFRRRLCPSLASRRENNPA